MCCLPDGDQCKSSPCKNGGDCVDQMGTYTCNCKRNYVGSDCEIGELLKHEVKNDF